MGLSATILVSVAWASDIKAFLLWVCANKQHDRKAMEYRTHIQTSYSVANVRSILGVYGEEHDNKWNEYMASLQGPRALHSFTNATC